MDKYGVFADMHDTARVNSIFVAQWFEKRHDIVLRDIRELYCSDEFRLLNFVETKYTDDHGRTQPCIEMTRDGFTFLAMGYRGKKAASFKEAYIKRFNEMEKFIKVLVTTRKDYPILTDAIKMAHENPKHYYYSNEADLLNRIITGKSAKEIRAEHGAEKGESIRPYLSQQQIDLMEVLQKVDTGLLISTPDYEQRKRLLEWYAAKWINSRIQTITA